MSSNCNQKNDQIFDDLVTLFADEIIKFYW